MHIESFVNTFLHILTVSYNTSNAPVLGDLGRTPLSVLYKYRSVKFWLIIVHDNNTRLRSEVRGNTWASEIKLLLYSFGFEQKLLDTAGQNWHIDVTINVN